MPRSRFTKWNRTHVPNDTKERCLFCKEPCGAKDSFKYFLPDTEKFEYFHIKCFQVAIGNMVRSLKENESKHGEENSEEVGSQNVLTCRDDNEGK
jgi:hypothetical protein